MAKILQKRKVNIACVQETRWIGSRARNADEYKLWYSGVLKGKNGVGILVDRELRESVVEVRRVNDWLISIKLVVGECTINVVSAYVPQAGLDEEIKRRFWEGLDDIACSIPPAEKLFIGGDFNGHIGSTAGGYGEVHGGFDFGDRNSGGTSLLDFTRAFELVIANSSFPKSEEHLVTFQSMVAKTQIEYLLLRRRDRGLCKDCKVISGETLATQHRLLVMDVGILMKRKKRTARGQLRIRWGALTKDKAQELERRLSVVGAWRSSGDASVMWSTMADYIREAAREVLEVLKGFVGGHKGDWWWNEVVQCKVEAKKATYLKLVGSTCEVEKSANRESRLYEDLGAKGREKKLFWLAKARERKARDLDQVRCIRDEDGDQDIVLGELGHPESHRDFGYCRRIKVGEVMGAMRKMSRGRATGPDEIPVPREVLWRCLEAKGVPVAYIRAITNMYDGAKARVRTVGGDSEHFPVIMGLHQGSALSQFLFALVMDALTHHVQGEVPWCMLFADDIVLIEETRSGVNERLEVWM
ncbi:PREDICTED: uncharacterized protein LOC109239007 [Nicotiana attenuata]|uniref:uncharacterized protein LOC109239007 n=1 Tax=Nicotiana attenuata TaxID=49451 RepID=UPI000905CDD7|nr:PREDICTED: uncharacterized protein LOC109239007 [Nicotiana attenuata]